MAERPKLRFGRMLGSILRRSLLPHHVVRVFSHSRRKGKHEAVYDFGKQMEYVHGKELTVFNDPQLQLYTRILPDDFLHYGYFDDVQTRPESISLSDLQHAQTRYAERVLEHVVDTGAPVLDVGAGMGGMARMLGERGFSPTALTPDRHQVRYIKATYPEVPVIEGRFHEVGWPKYDRHFGTVITAESFQYLFLDNALSVIQNILRPGGRWVMCDYFRRRSDVAGSGHVWDDFVSAAGAKGWRFSHQEDITGHILPTMAFVQMLGDRFGMSLLGYGVANLQRKRPGLNYVLAEAVADLEAVLGYAVAQSDPERWAADKRYMLLVLERDG
jgi:cyclopropane fatty-acyl-phospholipid synthase-like methyltransferase